MIAEKSHEPATKHGIPVLTPSLHWFDQAAKEKESVAFLRSAFEVTEARAAKAVREGNRALRAYQRQVRDEGRKILRQLKQSQDFGVVIAGRPYHLDPLVNHELARHFTSLGIPVLTPDALPHLHRNDLSKVRMETTIPFHARMLSAAMEVARHPNLELVQIVSFGCGHDAIISDEMQRILHESCGKQLLILKLDEGENTGPLSIRVKSFVETIRLGRARNKTTLVQKLKKLPEGFVRKFRRQDRQRTILAPNLSPSFSYISSCVLSHQGYKVEPLALADRSAFDLGKKYVHNDICFPAQVNVGEILASIRRGDYEPDEIAVGVAKNCEDCRAGQYATLLRKALDDAGYPQVPIITTAGKDAKHMHPGFKLDPFFQVRMLWGLTICDALETMRRRIKPYEENPGETDRVFDTQLHRVGKGLETSIILAIQAFTKSIDAFNGIAVVSQERKPRVGVTGEILMKYHPTANGNLENYLLDNGMEVVVPRMIDFFRRDTIRTKEFAARGLLHPAWWNSLTADLTDRVYQYASDRIERELKRFRFYEPVTNIHTLYGKAQAVMDTAFYAGEGWLIPAEIIHMLEEGINTFVIVQPFGCLPNHISGRGLIKEIKKKFPRGQILSLDYDPDTSFANIENRLQMLIIMAKEAGLAVR